jgi:hypothetical protein
MRKFFYLVALFRWAVPAVLGLCAAEWLFQQLAQAKLQTASRGAGYSTPDRLLSLAFLATEPSRAVKCGKVQCDRFSDMVWRDQRGMRFRTESISLQSSS